MIESRVTEPSFEVIIVSTRTSCVSWTVSLFAASATLAVAVWVPSPKFCTATPGTLTLNVPSFWTVAVYVIELNSIFTIWPSSISLVVPLIINEVLCSLALITLSEISSKVIVPLVKSISISNSLFTAFPARSAVLTVIS